MLRKNDRAQYRAESDSLRTSLPEVTTSSCDPARHETAFANRTQRTGSVSRRPTVQITGAARRSPSMLSLAADAWR